MRTCTGTNNSSLANEFRVQSCFPGQRTPHFVSVSISSRFDSSLLPVPPRCQPHLSVVSWACRPGPQPCPACTAASQHSGWRFIANRFSEFCQATTVAIVALFPLSWLCRTLHASRAQCPHLMREAQLPDDLQKEQDHVGVLGPPRERERERMPRLRTAHALCASLLDCPLRSTVVLTEGRALLCDGDGGLEDRIVPGIFLHHRACRCRLALLAATDS